MSYSYLFYISLKYYFWSLITKQSPPQYRKQFLKSTENTLNGTIEWNSSISLEMNSNSGLYLHLCVLQIPVH